jgi:hypothetical protein
MKFNVTAEDIAHGQAKDCANCPVARCMSRTLGYTILVGDDKAWPKNFGKNVRLPPHVVEFIARYDCDQQVQPFEFEIEIPEEWS